MNIKNLITNVKNKIVSLYTGGTTASYVAIGATAVTGIAAVTIGSVALISALTSEPEPTTQPVTTTTIVHICQHFCIKFKTKETVMRSLCFVTIDFLFLLLLDV